jgi:hypothetical protein
MEGGIWAPRCLEIHVCFPFSHYGIFVDAIFFAAMFRIWNQYCGIIEKYV